jgi:hypothetical protein
MFNTNGLSDHEAQIMIENVAPNKHKHEHNAITMRDINDQSLTELQLLLSLENWEEIFMEDDASTSYNKFLNTYLRIFHSCFPKKCKNLSKTTKPWITKGIKKLVQPKERIISGDKG